MDLIKWVYFIHLIADVAAHASIGFTYGSYLDKKRKI